jgi:ferredoxin
MKFGKESGLGVYEFHEIEICGDDIEPLINRNFNVVRRPPERLASARYYPHFLKNRICPRPVIDYKRCINCGSCIKQCPVTPKALDWQDGNKKVKPVYNYKRCIRCYCCQEICPEKAITIKIPLLGRLLY